MSDAPAMSGGVRSGRLDADLGLIPVTVVGGGIRRFAEIPIQSVDWLTRVSRWAASVVMVAFLMGIPLFLLWRSSSQAAVPLLLLYSAISFIGVTAISGQGSELLTRMSLVAMISIPGILAHLGLTFPRERQITRELPGVVWVPYGLTAMLLPAGWLAMDRAPLLWPTFIYLIVSLTAFGWIIIITSSAFAIREARLGIERARARLLCFGAVLLPIVPTFLISRDSGDLAEVATAYLWTGVVVMPLPIGLAISQYNLFSLEWDVRRGIARAIYLGFAAFAMTLVLYLAFFLGGEAHPIHDPLLASFLSFGCVLVVEILRGRILTQIEGLLAPKAFRLQRIRERYESEVTRLRGADEVARRLGATVREALGARSGCVFLRKGHHWRPAFPFGATAPVQLSNAREARRLLSGRKSVHLPLVAEARPRMPDQLEGSQVELLASIGAIDDPIGLILLGSSATETPYTGAEVEFLETLATAAGNALGNTALAEELISSERQATTGRIARVLAHDLGKDLAWLRRLTDRLPFIVHDSGRLERDLEMIRSLTEGLVEGVRDLLDQARRTSGELSEVTPLDQIVDRAVRRVERLHGVGRIVRSIEPAVRELRCHDNLERVIGNLLDNALEASRDNDPVRLFATVEDRWIRVEIIDSGVGIDRTLIDRVFEPGVTTRRKSGGAGIGLTVSREIVLSLGGDLQLCPEPVHGTRALLRVPLDLSSSASGF